MFVGPGVEALEVMGDKIRAKKHVAAAGVPVIPGVALTGVADDDGRRPRRATRCWSSRPRAAAARAWTSSSVRRTWPTRSSAPGGSPRRRSATTRCCSSGSCGRRGTSRCRCSPTATGTSSTSASASARCSVGTRRSSRRRRRRCSTSATRAAHRRGRLRRRAQRRLRRRRHRRVPGLRRRADGVLLHGDEHPAAGRAPGHRDGHRARPGRVAAADRRRRAADGRPGRRGPDRARGRGARLRRGPGARASCRPPGPCSLLDEPTGEGIRVDSALRRRARRSGPRTTRCSPR